jgi:predicted exporter
LSLVDLWIEDVTTRVVLWCFILLIVLWALLLAAADWLASRLHFDKLLSANAVEHALLKREIEKLRREQDAKKE